MYGSWKVNVICFVALTLFISSNASSDTKYEPLMLVRGARPMALGNAFEAIADDENAFHYNPAGLAQNEKIFFHLMIIKPEVTSDLMNEGLQEIQDIYEAIDTLASYGDPLENESPECSEAREELADRVEEVLDEPLAAKTNLPSLGLAVPFYVAEKYRLTVGGSIYTHSLVSLRVESRGLAWSDPVKDMLDNAIVYNVSTQWAWEIASAMEIPINKPPILSKMYVGTALRRINRSVFSDEDNPFTVEDAMNPDGPDGIEGTEDDFAKRYFDVDQDIETIGDFVGFIRDNTEKRKGYSIDLGTIFEPVDGLKLALVLRNLLSNVSLNGENRRFPRNVVLSTAVEPLVFLENPPPFLDLTLAGSLDRRNGDDRMSDFSANKYTDRIHLGAEFTFFPDNPVSFSGRLGNNQGFLTLGTSLRVYGLYLDFARYGDLEADWYAGYINVNLAF